MTIPNMIIVMQEASTGKKVQKRQYFTEAWIDEDNPTWAWDEWEYRIKPQATLRPFKDVEELISYWDSHYQDKKRPSHSMPLIWVKDQDGCISLLDYFNYEKNTIGLDHECDVWTLKGLCNHFTFLDGSPCGIKECV